FMIAMERTLCGALRNCSACNSPRPARAAGVRAPACNHSEHALLLFTLGTRTEKLHSGPNIMNDNPDRLIPNMSIALEFPGRLEAAASKRARPASPWVVPA